MLRDADLVERSRIIMEKPFGTDLASADELNDQRARGLRREPDLPHRPLPRQGGGAEHPRVPLRQRAVRADLEPQPHRPRPDRRARDARPGPSGPTSTRAPAPTATWSSPTCSRCSRSWRWSRRPRWSRGAISEEKNKVFRSMLPIEPHDVVRGQYDGYRDDAGRRAGLRHRDVHRAEGRDRQLALGRRAVLPAHRQADGRGRADHLDRLPGAAADDVPAGLRRRRRRAPTTSPSTSPTSPRCRCRSTASGPGPGMKLDKLSMQFAMQETEHCRRRARGLRAADPTTRCAATTRCSPPPRASSGCGSSRHRCSTTRRR